MSDIFISYKREEQSTARKLASALESEGWTVWWDPKLRAGERFNDVIEKALNESKCVVVMWSKRSVESQYVKHEANYALKRNKLVPVMIEEVELPFRFEDLHTPSLLGWDGSKEFLQFRRLVEDIAAIVGLPTTDARKADEAGERNRAKQMPSSPYGLDNVSSEDEIADFFHESISDLIASRKREREGEKFPLVHDGSVREYSRQEVDKLTTTQRAKLFTADPEMEAWWRGKLPNGAWPLFRLKGGIWIAKHEFDKLTEEHYAAIRRVIPGLLEWYLEEQRF